MGVKSDLFGNACTPPACFAGDSRVRVLSGGNVLTKAIRDVATGDLIQCLSTDINFAYPQHAKWCEVKEWVRTAERTGANAALKLTCSRVLPHTSPPRSTPTVQHHAHSS